MDGRQMLVETKRLFLRELEESDFEDLCGILQDRETMYAYEHAFSEAEAREWLERQQMRYRADGFGLWAVIHKETGSFIGQTGLTMQDWADRRVPEIGYLFNRAYWHHGFAAEAAIGCKRYGFDTLGLEELYSIIRDNNFASLKVAQRNGMHKVGMFTKHYCGIDMPHEVYRITQAEYCAELKGETAV